ncbi:MAG TPA: AraC family transcriptional regulator [Planctomycetota bacterium]|nr:AraC family transcriptional regulator [Planctomycetota bacterium]
MKAWVERISTGPAASFLCRRRTDSRFGFYWHFHPQIELTWIVRSRGRRFVGDSIEPYDDGDLVLLGPNLPHTWHSDARRKGRHVAVFCQFSRDFLGTSFIESPELSAVERLLERSARGLQFSGRTQKAVGRRMEGLDRMEGLPRLAALLEILDLLARSRDARPLSGRRFVPALRLGDAERIDRVCRFLNEHCLDRISLVEAAGVAHLSIPAFCRFFRRTTGKTLVEYLNELRTGLACRELIETERSVSEIAFGSGYHNLSNFNRRFRALKGLSPRAYRQAFRPRDH